MPMPLPSFSWASGSEVWHCMLEKDAMYAKLRNERMLDKHPLLCADHRTVLFEWLSEVSHECGFYRETYHLAIDFVDRYLSATSNIRKLQLQLIGTTCLFSAAKFEEIRPPTVQDFANLTDGACKPEDILKEEVVILSAIGWEMTPMTPNSWLNLYMQILHNLDGEDDTTGANAKNSNSRLKITSTTDKEIQHRLPNYRYCTNKSVFKNPRRSRSGSRVQDSDIIRLELPDTVDENSDCRDLRVAKATRDDSFIIPVNNGISRYSHKRIASLIDLALLHIESLRFSNSVLTASALYYFTSETTIQKCTAYRYQDILECINWLEPFVYTVERIDEKIFIRSCQVGNYPTQMHSHVATQHLLDETNIRMAKGLSRKRKSSALLKDESFSGSLTDSEDDSVATPVKPTTMLLTPPSSTRKSRRVCK